MMVGPASVRRFVHNNSCKPERTHRVITHSVLEAFDCVFNVWIGDIVNSVALEHKRAFHQSFFRYIFNFLCFGSKFQHIVFQLGNKDPSHRPKQVSLSIFIDKYIGVDTGNTFDRSFLWNIRTFGFVGHRHTYTKTFTASGSCNVCIGREIKIIFSIAFHTVGRPHTVRSRIHPVHFVLAYNYTMIGPIGKIFRRKHMIIGHAEPIFPELCSFGSFNVMRREKIDFTVKNPSRWVGCKLVMDNWILGSCT